MSQHSQVPMHFRLSIHWAEMEAAQANPSKYGIKALGFLLRYFPIKKDPMSQKSTFKIHVFLEALWTTVCGAVSEWCVLF